MRCRTSTNPTEQMARGFQQVMLGTLCTDRARVREALERIRGAGYSLIELNGFMIRPLPEEIRKLLDENGFPVGISGDLDWPDLLRESGLAVSGIHEDLTLIEQSPQLVIREAWQYDVRRIIAGSIAGMDYSDRENVRKLADRLNSAGKMLKKAGLSLFYHNHNCEFYRLTTDASGEKLPPHLRSETGYDALVRLTRPSLVSFEYDSYWAAEAGCDVLRQMRMLGRRMKLYHISDRGDPAGAGAASVFMRNEGCALGFGNMNLEAMMTRALANGTEAVIVEIHRNWRTGSPVQALADSSLFFTESVTYGTSGK